MEQELTKLSEIARETGVSTQTVRRYYAKLSEDKKQRCCNSFAVDAETKLLIIQQILSVPQNKNNNVATLLRSDSNEVLAYFERVIREKDAMILEQQKQIGLMEARLALPASDTPGGVRGWLIKKLGGRA